MEGWDFLSSFFIVHVFFTIVFYEDFAGELLEDICLHLPYDLAVDFADGLCGIGWADGAFGAMFRFDNVHKVESLQSALEALLSGKYPLSNSEVGRERMLNCYSLEDFRERIGIVYHSVNAL